MRKLFLYYLHPKMLLHMSCFWHFLSSFPSRGPACPTWPKTLSSGFWQWTPASGWRQARPSSIPGSSAWRRPPLWRTCSAAYLRTSWNAPRHAARVPSRPNPHAPAAPPSPTKLAGCERRSCASWTVAISSSITAESSAAALWLRNDWENIPNHRHSQC